MLKINDNYYVTRDSRNWCLTRTWQSVGKAGTKNEGKLIVREETTYYGSLDALCRHCIDKSLDPTGGFAQMEAQLVNARADLSKMIKRQGLEAKRIIAEAIN